MAAAARRYFSDEDLAAASYRGNELVLFDARFRLAADREQLEVAGYPANQWLREQAAGLPLEARVWEVVAFLKVRRLHPPEEVARRARTGELYDADYFTKRGGGGPYVGYPAAYTGQDTVEPFLQFADAMVDRYAPRRTLDLGCATGELVAALEARGVDAWGVDISDWAVEHAVSDHVVKGTATALRWEDDTFDVVHSQDFMEHVHPDDLPAVLAEQVRVAREGGRLLHLIPFYDAEEPFGLDAHLCQASLDWWLGLFERTPGVEIVRAGVPSAGEVLDRYVELVTSTRTG